VDLNFKYLKSKIEESGNITGQFVMNNLVPGQGLTIGNALRRVLLSNLEGTAITAIKIPGVFHEFSTIPGIREDILEIILNLKQIILKTDEKKILSGKINVKGPGIITGNSIKFESNVNIINPNQYIATISSNNNIEFELLAEQGTGYHFSDQLEQKYQNFLTIDAIFMPVINVNYKINHIYISYNKTIESLDLEITTNGSITPEKALNDAAEKLMIWFSSLTNEKIIKEEKPLTNLEINPQREHILIEELQLPIRAYNCLKRAGINSIDQLLNYSQEEIKEIKNFGGKSATELFQALKTKFNIILPSVKSSKV
jgi:DNA-directed RNA polymerase subunit alpha